MRVVIADDSMLIREGLARLLAEAGVEVAGTAEDAAGLLREVALTAPDAAVVDIKMPPTHTDEGLRAAQRIRSEHPKVSVLVLSQHLESDYARRLVAEGPGRVGYLLKDRVSDIDTLRDALNRLSLGECVIDPAIVSGLMSKRRPPSPLDFISPRERQVLVLLAEGRSNRAIADRLSMSMRTMETHVRQIFNKLGLPESSEDHRRVLAVLTYLRSTN
ncbi:LuxR family two component transcriptional regulator [Micromonospora kangleipakensis]|uniref:LuxR family two component transcriptional regulator n=1 Tax=Micromonospora kangleipakensis TaxID=1077942 RepID=A0A4Q8BEK0_9ACTN|nr:response regulator transcription factor [Micromonospora kangleipakensis]RZU76118.1 LuxR family two component transcriptional regulator [Micromonospora kangleipakensis]